MIGDFDVFRKMDAVNVGFVVASLMTERIALHQWLRRCSIVASLWHCRCHEEPDCQWL